MASMSQYSYEPLLPNEIRLITLFPGKVDDNLRCSVSHVQLAPWTFSQVSYEALSYMWGSQTDLKSIEVEGKHLFVGPALWRALRSLRSENKSRQLWVDAICINQKSDSERNKQVQRMRYIYNHANSVLVWLGDESEETSPQRPFVDALQQIPRSSLQKVSITSWWYIEPRWMASAVLLCRKRYWKRLWIVQEILSAQKVVICYDRYTCEWGSFIDMFRTGPVRRHLLKKYILESDYSQLEDDSEDKNEEEKEGQGLNHALDITHWTPMAISPPKIENKLLNIDSAWTPTSTSELLYGLPVGVQTATFTPDIIKLDDSRRDKQSLDLATLLLRYGDAECQDSRDRVYGLLGLANDCQNGEIVVDYGLDAKGLYENVVEFWEKKETEGRNHISMLRMTNHLRQLLL